MGSPSGSLPSARVLPRCLPAILLISAVIGCASTVYRVPDAELSRIVQLPPDSRGAALRVISWDPSSPVPPPPIAIAAPDVAPPDVVTQASAPISDDDRGGPSLNLSVGVNGSGPGPVARAPLRPRLAPPVRATFPGRAVEHAVSHGPRFSAGHVGGGGGHGGAIAAGVIAVILVAALIGAAASADHDAEQPFDGWARVGANHPIHLRYGRRFERIVPLSQLRAEDAAGLSVAFLQERDGPVLRLEPAPTGGIPAVR
jgi:hypothetical protein